MSTSPADMASTCDAMFASALDEVDCPSVELAAARAVLRELLIEDRRDESF